MNNYDGNILYGRRYRIIVGTGNGRGTEVSKLHCTFNIEKSMNETPNYSEAVIYNLSAQTENAFIKSGERIVIEAGYEGDHYGLIFDGDIIQPLRDKTDGTTYTLTLIAQDGDLFLNGGVINTSMKAGQTQRNIVNELTLKSSEKIQTGSISENLKDSRLARGKVVFGLARDYLRQISKSANATFYVNDRKVEIVKPNDLPQGRVIDLNAKSGLIGTPEQFDAGIKGKCLLNPFINLNTFIHVDNSSVRLEKAQRGESVKQLDQDGVYRIIKLNHVGDTRGDTWYTEFVGVSRYENVAV